MPELVDRPQPVANGRDIHSTGHADDSRVRVRPDAPDVQIGDPGVARPLDEFADLGPMAVSVVSSSTAAVSRIRDHDHRAMTIAPTMPISGSSQTHPI